MNGYELHRVFFDWALHNPEKVTPTHVAVYCWFVELNNRMSWSKHFAVPAFYCMAAVGIKSYNTFHKIYLDLIEWGFIEVIQKSKNQYTTNIIALLKFDKALDEATAKHLPKQSESTCDINKPIKPNKPNKQEKKSEKCIPPTLDEVIVFFKEENFSEELAKRAYNHYHEANWHDVNGKPVKNWKQKIRTVWFKPENQTMKYDTKHNRHSVEDQDYTINRI